LSNLKGDRVVLLSCLLILSACAFHPAPDIRTTGLANPASKNCIDKGGKLTLEKNPAKGEYGVCSFSKNWQCEEWALFRGDCPVGGVETSNNWTDAARYCVITGGEYHAQQEACLLPNQKVCNIHPFYNGKCPQH